jgi:hypothetical protein
MDSTSMLLQDFIDAPAKAESILDKLTAEQIQLIEATINSVKKRKLDQSVTPPSPPSEPEETPLAVTPGTTTSAVTQPNTTAVAAAIANALAVAMSSAVATTLQQQHQQHQRLQQSQPQQAQVPENAPQQPPPRSTKTLAEPMAQMKDGVEWVSFVYSHNRVMKNYTIRTDLHTITLEEIDDKFKTENCVSTWAKGDCMEKDSLAKLYLVCMSVS